ncbi:hypothetical protein NECAME_05716, partial [Necator americanus]
MFCSFVFYHWLAQEQHRIFCFFNFIEQLKPVFHERSLVVDQVCKVRSVTEGAGTMTKFTRHASFTNLTEPKKQYKYFHHLLIPNVREINRLKLFRYEGSVDDRLEPTGRC